MALSDSGLGRGCLFLSWTMGPGQYVAGGMYLGKRDGAVLGEVRTLSTLFLSIFPFGIRIRVIVYEADPSYLSPPIFALVCFFSGKRGDALRLTIYDSITY